MALKKMWRRELTPAEQRVDFKTLGDQWASAETALVDDLIPVMVQVIARLEEDLRAILESEKYSDLKEIKIGYKDKLVGIFKAHMIDAFKIGKSSVHKEFDITKEITIESKAREFMAIKAETVVTDMLDRIKANALFVVLDGIKAGHNIDQIISEVKGKPFKEQQAEFIHA